MSDFIASDYLIYFTYVKNLDFKNVPENIVKFISTNTSYSWLYAYNLGYKNVPLIIIKASLKDHFYFDYIIKNIEGCNIFLIFFLRYDKRVYL